jgi:hypothetical protein
MKDEMRRERIRRKGEREIILASSPRSCSAFSSVLFCRMYCKRKKTEKLTLLAQNRDDEG